MSIIHSLLSATNFRNPFLRNLIPSVGLAFGIQAAFGVPSIIGQTERFYDLSGSVTYLSCTALSLYLPVIRARAAAAAAGAVKPAWPTLLSAFNGTAGPYGFNWRQVVLSAAVSFWAARLGSFLFQRILNDGTDSRFEKSRCSPPKFAVAFFAQAVWVSLCLLPVLSINSLPASTFAALGSSLISLTDILGILLYVGGLGFEVTADRQKSKWSQEKKEKKHDEDYLTRGLWSKSRHPNYFGESTLWTGIATLAAGVLASEAGVAGIGLAGSALMGKVVALLAAGVSPAFVTFLLFKVSGIPLSEKKYDQKFGDREDYQRWKKETPMFFPKL
ncbi:uncharacterized protein A1O9_06209 [Exophiala aquamarina CBS 119918]|uniref:Uncharacterized protein n=1 Tax=Exophiala aquamarina CBS 119918 TaxID=1182545 RepID=A0A072PG94_9EURO|nr:uncharacterized protein A1O9_06209 [Exophiala aquamarina CBS 119918]KEF58283.1 hypothetical protein A1O9_06209 [Exophiala aquamarina CBS 119918]